MQQTNAYYYRRLLGTLPFLLVVSFFMYTGIPESAFADSSANFQIEIYYAKTVKEVDSTKSATVTLTNPSNSSLDILLPADVLLSGAAIELTAYSTPQETVTDDKPLPSGKVGADLFYELSTQNVNSGDVVSSFDKPISLTFSYTDAEVSGIIESTLKAYRWNGSSWVVLPNSTVNTALNTVTATTLQFSSFGLIGDPSPVCGNGAVESGEACDNAGSNGVCPATCSASCTTNACGSGGGGGGGSSGVLLAPVTSVTFTGKAYPKSTVTLLKDGQIAVTTVAGTKANFEFTISGLSGGNYIFSVYSEDAKGIHSSLLTFPVGVTLGATTKVGGIFIAPTIQVDKSEVNQGDTLVIFGQSVPDSDLAIFLNSSPEFFAKTKSDASGAYVYYLNTLSLAVGQYTAKAKATTQGEVSSLSKEISFVVGKKTVSAPLSKNTSKGDMNNDQQINLVDFSIAAYWYKRSAPPLNVDLNSDGKVDLVDFSIMAFYWTG